MKKNGWNECSECLPNQNEEVMTSILDENGASYFLCTFINGTFIPFVVPYFDYIVPKMTHWRYLPNPPKKRK